MNPRTFVLAACTVALGLGLGRTAVAAPAAAPAPPAAPHFASFEAAAAQATRETDLSSLLAPLLAGCDGADDLARRECEGLRAWARAYVAQPLIVHGDARSVSVGSAGAAGAKQGGVPVAITTCVACAAPLDLGGGERAFVTTRAPAPSDVRSASLRGADLAHTLVQIDPAAAPTFASDVAPYLTAEYVVRLSPDPWHVGGAEGFAGQILAQRIYDRCTGQVVESDPPTSGTRIDVTGQQSGCPTAAPKTAAAPAPSGPALPEQLSMTDVQSGLQRVRAGTESCLDKYRVPGRVTVQATVDGSSGKVVDTKVLGSFEGTPTGDCVAAAVSRLRFRRFQAPTQVLTLPFYLR